jgi:pilus assembly protein FimV
VFDSEALAASMGSPKAVTDAAEPAPEPIFKPIENAAEQPAAEERAAPTPARTDTPAWHSGWVKADPEPAAPVAVVQASVQPEPALAPAAVATAETAPAHASIEQRFKLVDAFLDMGDKTSAQQILAELLNDEDDAASEKAGRMLSKLMG